MSKEIVSRGPASKRQYITHKNGLKTAYIQDNFTDPWKKAETILIQHGFCRNADHFYHWVPALARKYNVIRRDLRGHGYSDYPAPGSGYDYEYSLPTILAEIKDTLDQLGIAKAHLLGESTSGMLFEAFAAKYPDSVLSLTVCSSPTYLPAPGQQFLAFGESSWPEACRKLGARGWAERLAGAQGTVASTDSDYVRWWIDTVAISHGEGLAGYAEFLGSLDARPFLSDIRAPVLILAPSNSAMVNVQDMEELAASLPTARLVVVDALGHEIYSEAAEACQKAVLEFLDSLQ
ncbi:hypothetical protein SBRCBS47491_009703 [Sporothrix bragantina]|uniref:AB hydrolase-1 domain-containing protein n=1 Tax=Sporothrix bragantina TaxID=671064 RepID=A0ABP0D039_9PEZI